MCWDPICTVAEVWRCSKHYLWLFGGGSYLDPFTAVYRCCAVVYEVDKTQKISGLLTWSLERESNTVSWCVRPWIKFTPEYPFNPGRLDKPQQELHFNTVRKTGKVAWSWLSLEVPKSLWHLAACAQQAGFYLFTNWSHRAWGNVGAGGGMGVMGNHNPWLWCVTSQVRAKWGSPW